MGHGPSFMGASRAKILGGADISARRDQGPLNSPASFLDSPLSLRASSLGLRGGVEKGLLSWPASSLLGPRASTVIPEELYKSLFLGSPLPAPQLLSRPRQVTGVRVEGLLHLKTGVTALPDGTLLFAGVPHRPHPAP